MRNSGKGGTWKDPNVGLRQELQSFGERERLFAWFMACGGFSMHAAEYQVAELRNNRINNFVFGNSQPDMSGNSLGMPQNNFRFQMERKLLSIKEFEWIGDDRRQQFWLYQNCPPDMLKHRDFFDQISGLSQRTIFIACLDVLEAPLPMKLNSIRSLRKQWLGVQLYDKSVRWLDKKNKPQLAWAWDYIQNKRLTNVELNSLGLEDPYAAVFCAIDRRFPPDGSNAREEFIGCMQKAWQQIKNRASNTEKTQCNLWISVEAKKSLDILAKKKNMKKNQLVEFLIKQEEHACMHPPVQPPNAWNPYPEECMQLEPSPSEWVGDQPVEQSTEQTLEQPTKELVGQSVEGSGEQPDNQQSTTPLVDYSAFEGPV